jgi:hypothetical protein
MKKALIVFAVFVGLLAGAAYWVYTSLDFVVKGAIERYAPDVTGVAVKISSVHISTTDGIGMINGFDVANPPGYRSPYAVRVGEISVVVEPATITQDVIVIREILVQAPVVTYEIRGKTNNLETIQKNIEAFVKRSGGESSAKDAPGRTGTARKYIFDRIALQNAKVTMSNSILKSGGITFDIPDIDLRDLGRRTNGITAGEAAKIVTNALLAKIAQKVLTDVELLRKGGSAGAIEALKGLLR